MPTMFSATAEDGADVCTRIDLNNHLGQTFYMQCNSVSYTAIGGSRSGVLCTKQDADLVFGTDDTERMRIKANGDVLIAGLAITPGGPVIIGAVPVYANDGAARAGGLTAGMLYRTSVGDLRIKT